MHLEKKIDFRSLDTKPVFQDSNASKVLEDLPGLVKEDPLMNLTDLIVSQDFADCFDLKELLYL